MGLLFLVVRDVMLVVGYDVLVYQVVVAAMVLEMVVALVGGMVVAMVVVKAVVVGWASVGGFVVICY